MPLITERLAYNVVTFRNSVANIPIESRYTARKLHGNGYNELVGMANISAAS